MTPKIVDFFFFCWVLKELRASCKGSVKKEGLQKGVAFRKIRNTSNQLEYSMGFAQKTKNAVFFGGVKKSYDFPGAFEVEHCLVKKLPGNLMRVRTRVMYYPDGSGEHICYPGTSS